MEKKIKWIIFILADLLLLALFFLTLPLWIFPGEDAIFQEASEAPDTYEVALVFGAGLTNSGSPSLVLSDRLQVAAELYFLGKVDKILVSGDNSIEEYDEPTAMYDFLIAWGVDEEDIAVDFAGRRTYDTCARAHEIWGVEKALLVTQEFHLPRALFLCESLGIESEGVSSTLQTYRNENVFESREILAQYKAILDVYLWAPSYIGGEAEEL
jgi:SanA protein